MDAEVILLDVDSDEYTLGQVMQMIDRFQDENPDMEVYLDGDRHAIIGKRISR